MILFILYLSAFSVFNSMFLEKKPKSSIKETVEISGLSGIMVEYIKKVWIEI